MKYCMGMAAVAGASACYNFMSKEMLSNYADQRRVEGKSLLAVVVETFSQEIRYLLFAASRVGIN